MCNEIHGTTILVKAPGAGAAVEVKASVFMEVMGMSTDNLALDVAFLGGVCCVLLAASFLLLRRQAAQGSTRGGGGGGGGGERAAAAAEDDVEGSFNSSRRNSGSFNSGEEVEMGRVATRESLVE